MKNPRESQTIKVKPPRPDKARDEDFQIQAPGDVRREKLGIVAFAVVIFAVTLTVYQPAWHGGLLWDDEAHITRTELRAAEGLWRIWFELGATQQYYPLLHSAFWLQHRLWGDDTLGYHLVNIVLHALCAVLVVLILKRLKIPGAFLAGTIFALHPVHVESVAWMTELKNTLSGVIYLAAALAYLRFDEGRRRGIYFLALVLFVLALLSKTVTATLPAALLVVFWWQRGRINWHRDVLPLVPFFVLGVSAGLFTVWVERTFIRAEGSEFAYTLIERCLIAGRVIWFYLGKLLWPVNLNFIYPRWEISQAAWWQYLYPLGVIGLLVGLWLVRNRTRAPLAALLLFCGTLFPALGFFNVYPFTFSFVADHFQYLASLGIITLFSAAVALLLLRWRLWPGAVAWGITLGLGLVLGVRTWQQSRIYTDSATLYAATLAGNPDCWLAHNNWGVILQKQGHVDEAVARYQEALRIKPDYAEAHNNWGGALQNMGHIEEAVEHYQEALRIEPHLAAAHFNLGLALSGLGRVDEAVPHYREVLRIEPNRADVHNNLGTALQAMGRFEDAVAHYQEAARIHPNHAGVHNNLAWLLSTCPDAEIRDGRRAVKHAEKARRQAGEDNTSVLATLSAAYAEVGNFQQAVRWQEKAVQMAPSAQKDVLRGRLELYKQGKPYREKLRAKSD